MRSAATFVALLALIGAPAASTAPARAETCSVLTLAQGGRGNAMFTGTCNRGSAVLRVNPFSVTGHLGRARASFKRTGSTLAGKLGTTPSHLAYEGFSIRGTVGKSAVKLAVGGSTVSGHLGTQRVTCSLQFLSPLGEKISCTGNGAAAIVPFLALLYAAP